MTIEAEQSDGISVDWRAILFSKDLVARLQDVSAKRFGETVHAEEAFTECYGKLIDPAWQQKRLASFRGTASPATYICVVFKTLLEDFSRSRFGRPRPPAWVKRLGPLWEKVFRLLCLERFEPDTLVGRLCATGERKEDAVWQAIETIRAEIPNCGEHSGEISQDFSTDDPISHSAFCQNNENTPEEALHAHGKDRLFQVLAHLLSGSPGHDEDDPRFGDGFITLAAQKAELLDLRKAFLPSELLLLRMVFQDGLKISAVARRLLVSDHCVRQDLKKCVARLRELLSKAGITASVAREYLE